MRTDPLPTHMRERLRDTRRILVMRGLRSLAYGLLAVLLGVALAGEGFTPVAIGALITVSLVGDMVGTYVIGLSADTWGGGAHWRSSRCSWPRQALSLDW